MYIPKIVLIFVTVFVLSLVCIAWTHLTWAEDTLTPQPVFNNKYQEFYYTFNGILFTCSFREIPGLVYWVCFDVYRTPTPSLVYDHY